VPYYFELQRSATVSTLMKTSNALPFSARLDRTARRAVRQYFKSHPDSPAAKYRPRLGWDHGRYVALLGRSLEVGIVGFGSSVTSALHTFDDLYRKSV
jgi:hypothetical protein